MATAILTLDQARRDFEAFYDTYCDIVPDQHTPLVQMDNDDQKDYRVKEVSSLKMPEVTSEGSSFNVDSRHAINEKTWAYKKYTLGLEYTDEAQYTDQFGTFAKDQYELTKAFRQNRNLQVANLFNNAWDSTYTGPDGLVLAHTAHLTGGGTTFANEPSAHGALSPTTVKEGITAIRKQKDSRGRRMYSTGGNYLIVPPDEVFTAREILESVQLADTADNNKNVLGEYMELMVLDEVTIEDFWGLVPKDKMDCPFLMPERMPFRVETDRIASKGVDMIYAHEEFLVGWRLPYRTWLVSVTEG
jgi:hypothetical protein